MNKTVDPTRLAALQKTMPERIHAAARAVHAAESRLAQLLAWRAAGQTIKRSDLAVARMALTRAERDAEDLQRIMAILPELLNTGRPATRFAPLTADVGD